MSGAGLVQVGIQKANNVHQAFLADPAFFWEGGNDGCFARAVLMVDGMLAEGVPGAAIGKIAVVHAEAPLGGWDLQTRLGTGSNWMQHIAPTLETDHGLRVIDPMLCDVPVEPPVWLERFPPERLNPAAAPSQRFIQALLHASDANFRLLLAAASTRPEFYKHLLADMGIATRLAQFGEPVRYWIERAGPSRETFDDHLQTLPATVKQTGPMVKGEVIRVAFGIDLFIDYPWDLASPESVGVTAARAYLLKLRRGKP